MRTAQIGCPLSGQTRKHLLGLSFTGFDPLRTPTPLASGERVVKSFSYPLTDLCECDILPALGSRLMGDRMQFDQTNRREFTTLLGGAVAAWPLAARAQQPTIPVIGFIRNTTRDDSADLLKAMHQGLRQTGFFHRSEKNSI